MTDGGRLYFDQKLQECNWPTEVDCEVDNTNPPSPTAQSSNNMLLKNYPLSDIIDCSHAKDGQKFSSQKSCSEFYECSNGVAYLFQCANMTDGGRLYFDQQLQECNWPSEVDCEVGITNPPVHNYSYGG